MKTCYRAKFFNSISCLTEFRIMLSHEWLSFVLFKAVMLDWYLYENWKWWNKDKAADTCDMQSSLNRCRTGQFGWGMSRAVCPGFGHIHVYSALSHMHWAHSSTHGCSTAAAHCYQDKLPMTVKVRGHSASLTHWPQTQAPVEGASSTPDKLFLSQYICLFLFPKDQEPQLLFFSGHPLTNFNTEGPELCHWVWRGRTEGEVGAVICSGQSFANRSLS